MKTSTSGKASVTFLSPANVQFYLGKETEPADIKLQRLLEKNSNLKLNDPKLHEQLTFFIESNKFSGDVTNARLLLADLYFRDGNYEKVRGLYQEVIDNNPTDVRAKVLKNWINSYDGYGKFTADALRRAKLEFDISQLEKEKQTIFGFGEGKGIQLFTKEEIAQGQNTPSETVKRTLLLLYGSGNLVRSTKEALKGTPFIPSEIGGGPEEIKYRANLAGADLITKYIEDGSASTIEEAIKKIQENGDITATYGEQIYDDGAGGLLTYSQIYDEISANPTIKAAVKLESIPSRSQEQIDKINVQMAKDYRERGLHFEALNILAPIIRRQTIGYSESEKEARKLADEILGEGIGFSDATKDSFFKAETVGEFTNVFMSGGGSLLLKAGKYGVSKSATLYKLSSAAREFKALPGESVIGKVLGELGWEGVETIGGVIDPRLEIAAMIIDGGNDVDFRIRQAIEKGVIEQPEVDIIKSSRNQIKQELDKIPVVDIEARIKFEEAGAVGTVNSQLREEIYINRQNIAGDVNMEQKLYLHGSASGSLSSISRKGIKSLGQLLEDGEVPWTGELQFELTNLNKKEISVVEALDPFVRKSPEFHAKRNIKPWAPETSQEVLQLTEKELADYLAEPGNKISGKYGKYHEGVSLYYTTHRSSMTKTEIDEVNRDLRILAYTEPKETIIEIEKLRQHQWNSLSEL